MLRRRRLQVRTPRLVTRCCSDSGCEEGPRTRNIFLAHSANDRSPSKAASDSLQFRGSAGTSGFLGPLTAFRTLCTSVIQSRAQASRFADTSTIDQRSSDCSGPSNCVNPIRLAAAIVLGWVDWLTACFHSVNVVQLLLQLQHVVGYSSCRWLVELSQNTRYCSSDVSPAILLSRVAQLVCNTLLFRSRQHTPDRLTST